MNGANIMDLKSNIKSKEITQINNTYLVRDNILKSSLFHDAFIDITITSPPYNVGIDYATHDDEISYSDYMKFTRKWLQNVFKWTKDGGRLILNVPLDKNKGGRQSVGADITIIAKSVGWQYFSTIIWNEGNISRRTAWGSWLSATAPHVIAPVELIIIFYKTEWKREKNNRTSDIERDDFIKWTNGVWTFNGESKKRIGHPAPFPRELPKRCIKLFSFKEDVIFDPFVGSGTTLVEAISLGRTSVGVDIDQDYIALAKDRINKEVSNIFEGVV
jgi:site-specific DNA-methyltransferase (adenine-specific)